MCSAVLADWNGREASGNFSKSCPLRKPQASVIAADALALIKRWADQSKGWGIYGLSLSTGNFVAAPTGNSTLQRCQVILQLMMQLCARCVFGGGN